MTIIRILFILVGLCFSTLLFAFSQQEVSIKSPSMRTSYKATIILPDGYNNNNYVYPVVYILHGWNSNHTDWAKSPQIPALADRYQMILVMPSGNTDSWYINSPVKTKSSFETYIGKEVVNYIDKQYRTIAKKEGRAITGFSMGGFGALNVAINYADRFIVAGSLNGAVDPRSYPQNFGLEKVFGSITEYPSFWDEKVIINNIHRLMLNEVFLVIDIGVDDFLIYDTRLLHDKLNQLKIPHNYTERPGGHMTNLNRTLESQLLVFNQMLSPQFEKENQITPTQLEKENQITAP